MNIEDGSNGSQMMVDNEGKKCVRMNKIDSRSYVNESHFVFIESI